MRPVWLAVASAAAAFAALRRRRLEPTLLAGLVLLALGAALYGLGVFSLPDPEKTLEDLGERLGTWTYALVGGLAFAETGAFVGLLAPGETAILVGGVVAGQGQIGIVPLIALVWVCAVAGDVTSFLLGRRLGRGFLERHGRRVSITPERLETVEAFFDRHGGKAILLGRFVGLIRAIAPFLAGSSGMSMRRFLPYDVLGAGLWGTTFCLLGYVFWRSFGTVLDYAKTGAIALGSTICVVVAVTVVVRFLRRRENRERLRARLAAETRRPGPRGALARALGPVVLAAERPARWLHRRLTPGELGLEVTTLVAVLAVGLFATGAYGFAVDGTRELVGDREAERLADGLRTQALVDVSRVVTELGHLWATSAAAALASFVLLLRGERLEAVVVAAGFALSALATEVVRDLVDRPRPTGGLVETTASSFPSGHTSHAVLWLVLAVVVARVLPGLARRAVVVALGGVVVLVVAATRVQLRAHHLSDVVAGAGLAAACFATVAGLALFVTHVRQDGAAR